VPTTANVTANVLSLEDEATEDGVAVPLVVDEVVLM
jgi:hypothetical protein